MKRKIYISPSILTVKPQDLAYEIQRLEKSGADYIHIDVMDGKFVSNSTYSISDVKDICHFCNSIKDVHIMINDPDKLYKQYILAGAEILTFHSEAIDNNIDKIISLIKNIKQMGCKAGISFKPNTKIVEDDLIKMISNGLDLVLVMSVEPGRGGQTFIESSLEKISFIRKIIDENQATTLIEVDGGINNITGKKCIEAGADILVAGSYLVYKRDIKKLIKELKS